jgi:hypothetical protein
LPLQHLYDLLLERAELAAERIIDLEADVYELYVTLFSCASLYQVDSNPLHCSKEELRANRHEVKNLGVVLKALEVACDTAALETTHPDLVEGLLAWRREWIELKSRTFEKKRARRLRGHGSSDLLGSSLMSTPPRRSSMMSSL